MTIEYKNIHEFSEQDLKDLFLSVEWSSGHFPDKLVVAMKNFKTVISAWDGDKLVGMICAMDDGIMNAYVHYLLIRPEYQGQSIGKELVERVKEIYAASRKPTMRARCLLPVCGHRGLFHPIAASLFRTTAFNKFFFTQRRNNLIKCVNRHL